MKRAEQLISLIWISLAILICIGSLNLKLGSFHDPGPGFFPFISGVVLGLLATVHLINNTLKTSKKENIDLRWKNVKWKNAVYVIVALLIYTILLPLLGYIFDTLFLMFFLFFVLGRKKIWVSIVGSLLIIGFSYLIFKIWLMVQFPKGFLGIG